MISVDMIFLGSGSVLVYAFDAAFQRVPHGWRYMVCLGAIPSIPVSVFLFRCPESPRQLMYHNKRERCVRVVRQIYPNTTEEQIADKVLSIEHGVSRAKAIEGEMTVAKSLRKLLFILANLRAAIAA